MQSEIELSSEPVHYAKWRKIMSEYESSGLNQPEYCKQQGHPYRQFKYYRSRLAQLAKNKTSPTQQVSFAPVTIPASTSQGLRIELGHGAYCLMQSPSDAILVNALLQGVR